MTESTREFALANGRVLHIHPLKNWAPVRHIILELAKLAGTESLESLKNASKTMPQSDQLKMIALYQQLARYVIGWGVSDDPPADTDEVLSVLELEPRENRPNISRANWLMFGEIGSDEERQELISAIQALSTEAQPAE